MDVSLASGELMISTTELDGVTTLRFVVMNHRTTETEVRRSIDALARMVTDLVASEA